jgi:phosphoglycolate phosphatase-like HAD superfamily hydrolase
MVKKEKLPLCIDLDGTLIRSDVTHEGILLFIKKYPWKTFYIFVWLCKGRAFLKEKLAKNVTINPSLLPYNKKLLSHLKNKTKEGYDLYLVTAADKEYAKIVFDYLKIFKGYLASDGVRNLRASNKAKALCEKFGNEKFIYAGNSRHDLPVWKNSAEIIAVNTPRKVLEKANTFYKKVYIFQDKPLTLKDIFKDLTTYAWFRYHLFFYLSIMISGCIFKKIKVSSFECSEYLIFSIALPLLNTAAVLLGLLLHLEEVRMNPITKETFLSTSHLTIVKVTYLSIILTIIGLALGLFLSLPYFAFLILFFIFQFLYSISNIRSKNEE